MRCARALGLLVGFGSVLGCASLPSPPVHLPVANDARAGMTQAPPPSLRLRPGDVVEAHIDSVVQTGAFSTQVAADGNLYVPGVGSVAVRDKSLSEADDAATALLQRIDRFGRVDFVMRERAGQRVTILGAIQTQGTVVLRPGMRVADVIYAAGGPLSVPSGIDDTQVPLGDLSAGVLVRDEKTLPIDLGKALQGAPAHNVYVHPGDYIYVPLAEQGTIRVMGQVGAASVFAARPGLRLTEALAVAGGVAVGGDLSDVRLVRGPVEHPQVFSADVAAIVSSSGPDAELAPGDLVYVTDDPLEDFGEVLGILAPLAAVTSAAIFTSLLVNL